MDSNGLPLFSIILPTYNNEQDLEKCICSILNQTYTNFELILVDDGSTDATPQICDSFSCRDYRVKVIHKINEGVVAARNDGLLQAIGKYIYYVDGDDWIAKELLQEAVLVLDTLEAPDIFIFGYNTIMEDGQYVSNKCSHEFGLYNKIRLESEIYPKMIRRLDTILPRGEVSGFFWDKIISKELLKAHYCKDKTLFCREDMVSVYECMYYAEKIYFSPKSMYYYNLFSENSMHQRYHADLFENNRAVAQYLRKHLGERGNCFIDYQINKVEFDGIIESIYQEIKFSISLTQSVRHMKGKFRSIKKFWVCPVEGLLFWEKCYVFSLSLRLWYPTLFLSKIIFGLAEVCKII